MKRIHRYLFSMLGVLFILAVISICVGRYPLDIQGIFHGLFTSEDTMSKNIFFQLRLPRTIFVIASGFGLSLVGSILQSMFKNPLAAPDIIGVSSGAGAGVAVGIVVFGGSFYITMTSAFFGGLIAVTIAVIFAQCSKQKRLATFVLSGIAVNAIAQSLTMYMKLVADPQQQLASIEFWLMGGFNNITSTNVWMSLPIIVLGVGLLLGMHRQITLLSLSDDDAISLGVNLRNVRSILLVLTTLVVATIVSSTGLISFIGLIAPHIARLLCKANHMKSWIISGLIGSCLLLVSDIIARSVGTSEIPISIITSLCGAPLLIYFLLRREEIL